MTKQWFQLRDDSPGSSPVELYIYEAVYSEGCDFYGGVCPKDIVSALSPYRDREIVMRVNSPGGDVFAGIAIYNFLRDFKITTIIDGLAASISSVIALAGRKIRMSRSAFIMVHNPSGLVIGGAEDMREFADHLDKTRDTIAGIYEREVGVPKEKAVAWMEGETWFSGEEALAAGFVDELTDDPPVAMNDLAPYKFRNIPSELQRRPLPRLNNGNPMNTVPLISDCGCGGNRAAQDAGAKVTALEKENGELKAEISRLMTDLDGIRKTSAATLETRAAAAIDAAIADGRIDAPLREPMIKAYLADEPGTLVSLSKLKPRGSGTEPLQIRSGGGIGTRSLREQINSEPDAAKRRQLFLNNYERLSIE
jgi:ATP-dependent Clp endopeptidase proteolytic subunit ClpP